MSIRTVARVTVALIVVSLALPPRLAEAAPLRALPATVRVNVAGLGTVSARIGSTGALRVMGPDGAVLYTGGADTVARTNVYRLAEGPAEPQREPPALTREEWINDRQFALGQRIGTERPAAPVRVVALVPFELAVISAPLRDAMGDALLRAERAVTPIRYEATDGLLTFNGRVFRGTLELALDDAGDLIVVNTVDTRLYLASVIGSEIPLEWHPQAKAAQAIAARTYLMTHLGRHRAYDLEGDVRDQNYEGFGKETRETLQAVDRTAGIVATYNGRAIEALYSANAGGVTEDSENVWGNRLPYLRSVPSPWDEAANNSSWGRTSWQWTKEVTAPQLGEQMKRRGIDVGEPTSIEILRTAASGRVLEARVTGTTATRTVGRDITRSYFGLRSSLFTVEKRAGGETEIVHYLDSERIRTLNDLGARVVGHGYRIVRGDGEHASLEVNSYHYRLPDRFVFRGRGYGHGIGMSQWGMQGMALAGKSAEEMLRHYYQGIELTDVGGA
jgi:stage II sporulation protein D